MSSYAASLPHVTEWLCRHPCTPVPDAVPVAVGGQYVFPWFLA